MALSPRISGDALRALARLSKTSAGGALMDRLFRAELRLAELERLPEAYFAPLPVDNRPVPGRPPRETGDAKLPPPPPPWSATSATLTDAYRSGSATPRQVVDRALDAARALASRTPSVGPFTVDRADDARREADASTERWRRGAPLGPLDGVPVAVKEQTAVRGLPTRGGSDVTEDDPAGRDATCVARLRAAGAIVIGQTVMTELGMTPIGFNPKRAMPRNPHAADRVAGGSSTGSGVAVAAGVAPIAVGADGGGSIRIPAALCGVFGIKPTWGRVSRDGDIFGGSVAHVGPIASSALDLARFLDAASGPDPGDPQTALAPPLAPGAFVRALSRGVRGLRVGIEPGEWAAASSRVARAGREALRALEADGATLVDAPIELARWAAPVGYVTIVHESLAAQYDRVRRGAAFNPDLAISFAGFARTPAVDYVRAQRLRAGLRAQAARALRDVDLIALPATATTAMRVTDAEFASGFVDARAVDALCRFNFLGNLTGLPALSAPVGLDDDLLPIGLQLVGDAWDEATVLAAAAHLERVGAARVQRPAASAELL